MKEHLLGHMQIANDKIQIAEVEFDEGVVQKWYRDQYGSLDGYTGRPADQIEWFAFIVDNEKKGTIVSYAALVPINDRDVRFRWVVTKEYRGLGLGRLMARFATDEAIRYRKRAIVISLEKSNAIAQRILEDEEFEIVAGEHSGTIEMRKELKWQ